jgi:hypothetical protein
MEDRRWRMEGAAERLAAGRCRVRCALDGRERRGVPARRDSHGDRGNERCGKRYLRAEDQVWTKLGEFDAFDDLSKRASRRVDESRPTMLMTARSTTSPPRTTGEKR